MRFCDCGQKVQNNEWQCYDCKIEQKRRWRAMDEWSRVRGEIRTAEKLQREKRKEEDKMEAEAYKRRLEEENRKRVAEAEKLYETAIKKMSNGNEYDADDEIKLKSKRNSKGFQRRRRNVIFPADEINIREKYLEKIKVSEFIQRLSRLKQTIIF